MPNRSLTLNQQSESMANADISFSIVNMSFLKLLCCRGSIDSIPPLLSAGLRFLLGAMYLWSYILQLNIQLQRDNSNLQQYQEQQQAKHPQYQREHNNSPQASASNYTRTYH